MNNLIKSTFIFTLMLFTSLKGRDTEGSLWIKSLFEANRFCVGQTNYDAILDDKIAMKYYVDKLCSKVNPSNAKQYLKDNYGVKNKKMGQGSFGAVYKFIKGSEKFAIKVPSSFEYEDLFKELNGSECLKERLKNDSELANMAFIQECIRPRGQNPHLIMKFYAFTLKDNIDSKYGEGWAAFNEKKKTKMVEKMYTIAKELYSLHKQNLAHRDLKLENIMVTAAGKPILVDFGLLSPKGDNAHTLCGTPYYIDYEVLNKNGGALSSDVYSLLMTYVAMLHGKRAYNVLEYVLRKGGYTEYTRGQRKTYNPNFSDCKVPSEFNWMQNMFIPSKSGRWKMKQVVEQFEKMLGLSQDPVPEKKNIPEMVNEGNNIVNRLKHAVKDRVDEDLNNEKYLAIGESAEPKQIIDNNRFNNPDYAKNPYLKKAEKDEVSNKPDLMKNNYYNYEQNIRKPVVANVLNINKRNKDFLERNKALDQMIEEAIQRRNEQKRVFEAHGHGAKRKILLKK